MRIFWESSHRARRQHHCDHCHFPIEPEECYRRYAWVPARGRFYSGRFYIRREHHDCPAVSHEWEEAMLGPQEHASPAAIALVIEIREVVVALADGTSIIEPKTVVVPQMVDEEDLWDFGPDEEVPF